MFNSRTSCLMSPMSYIHNGNDHGGIDAVSHICIGNFVCVCVWGGGGGLSRGDSLLEVANYPALLYGFMLSHRTRQDGLVSGPDL